jgi:hypothetical protein
VDEAAALTAHERNASRCRNPCVHAPSRGAPALEQSYAADVWAAALNQGDVSTHTFMELHLRDWWHRQGWNFELVLSITEGA